MTLLRGPAGTWHEWPGLYWAARALHQHFLAEHHYRQHVGFACRNNKSRFGSTVRTEWSLLNAFLGEQRLIKHFPLSVAESHRCFRAETLSRVPNVSTSHTKLVRSQTFTVLFCVCLYYCMCLSNPLPVLRIRSWDGELPNTSQVQSKLCSTKIKTIIPVEV